MEKPERGNIRSINSGLDTKTGGGYTVGKRGGLQNSVISSILRNENSFYFYGFLEYEIYIKINDSKEVLWRTVPGNMAVVTYDISE